MITVLQVVSRLIMVLGSVNYSIPDFSLGQGRRTFLFFQPAAAEAVIICSGHLRTLLSENKKAIASDQLDLFSDAMNRELEYAGTETVCVNMMPP